MNLKQKFEKAITVKLGIAIDFDAGEIDQYFVDGDYVDYCPKTKTVSYPCQSCGQMTDADCSIDEWSREFHYCGKNQWCLP